MVAKLYLLCCKMFFFTNSEDHKKVDAQMLQPTGKKLEEVVVVVV